MGLPQTCWGERCTLRRSWNYCGGSWRAPRLLRRYQAFATGAGNDEDGPFMALVLVHRRERDASSNVGRLRQRIEEGSSLRFETPWADIFDTNRIEVRADGRVPPGQAPSS